MTIIDFDKARGKREPEPAPEFVRKDEFGRALYMFTAEYDRGTSVYGFHFWAYSHEDAAEIVAAMNAGEIRLCGQVFDQAPS